jgi:hypothetical protein
MLQPEDGIVCVCVVVVVVGGGGGNDQGSFYLFKKAHARKTRKDVIRKIPPTCLKDKATLCRMYEIEPFLLAVGSISSPEPFRS